MTVLLNIILFLYQFEFISYGGLSVYRCLIFPLLIYGILKYKIKLQLKDLKWVGIVGLFFIIEIISSLYYGDYWSIIDITGQCIQFIFIYNFLMNYKFARSTLWVLATWSFSHLICFITGTDTIVRQYIMGRELAAVGQRFYGFHWDPNYLCAYLLVAMWAKVYLLKIVEKFSLKILLITFIVLDISMILASLSKGGFLTLSLTALFYFIIYNKKIAVGILAFLILFGAYAGSVYAQLGWGESSFVNRQIYRFITQSVEKDDVTTGRAQFYQNYFDMMKFANKGIFIGMSERYFIDEYNGGTYPHSLIIGLWLWYGFLFGSLFLLILLYLIFKGCIYSFIFREASFEFIFALTFFCVFFNLSIAGLKFTWFFFGIFFALSSKETFLKRLNDVKTFNHYSRLQS